MFGWYSDTNGIWVAWRLLDTSEEKNYGCCSAAVDLLVVLVVVANVKK
jgi:hypothetical protein